MKSIRPTISLLCIVLSVVWTACSLPATKELDKSTAELRDSIAFNTQMAFVSTHCGLHTNSNQGEHYYYFANVISDKLIRFFDTLGQPVTDIPLVAVNEKGVSIDNFVIFSLDTVVVMSNYTNRLFFLNRKGKIWKELNLNDYSEFRSIGNIECRMSASSKSGNESIVLQLDWQSFKDDTILRAPTVAYYSNYYKKKWNKVFYLKVSNLFSDSLSFTSGFKLFKQVAPQFENTFFLHFDDYIVAGDRVLMSNLYNDNIYELDAAELQLAKSHELDRTQNIGIDFSKIDSNTVRVSYSKKRHKIYSQAIISSIHHNPYLDHFYVALLANTKEKDSDKRKEDWLIYDRNFKKIGQLSIDRKVFGSGILPSPRGLMIQKKTSVTNYKQQQAVFYEYVY